MICTLETDAEMAERIAAYQAPSRPQGQRTNASEYWFTSDGTRVIGHFPRSSSSQATELAWIPMQKKGANKPPIG